MCRKVLILVNHDVVIYNFRKELIERLLSEGYKVVISSPYGERIDDLMKLGCEYIEATIDRHGTNPVMELKLLSYYMKLMKQVKPNIVLTYTIKPNIYGGLAAKSHGIPYIANITGLGTAVEKNGVMQKLTINLYKLAFSKIQKVFFQNTENMNFFKNNNIVLGRHELVSGSGVNLDHFHVLDYPSDDMIEFVFISRIMQEKGIEQFLDAAKYFTNKYENIKFHVCGFCEEKYENKLMELQSNGVITYHGMVRDIRTILINTHCTIHPSYYPEGISNVLLESSASGRPIITTNRSGCREVIDNEVNGYMISPRNSSELIDKIKKFLYLSFEEKKQMGIAGRVKVEKEFDRQRVVDAYINEINSIE